MKCIRAIALGLGLTFAAAAHAEPTPPKPWIDGVVKKAQKLADARVPVGHPKAEAWEADVTALVDDTLDWPELTRRSLGSQWKKLEPAQQETFAGLLRGMIEASYKSKLGARDKDAKEAKAKAKQAKVEWTKEKLKGEKAELVALLTRGRSKTELEFDLRWSDARWRVWDVSIDDVSTVRTYRSQFRKLLADKGFDALIERMKKKTEEIEKGLADLR